MGATLDLMTPFLLAALGGLYSERAGVLNIALEGHFLAGAFSAIVVFQTTGNFYLASVAALLTGLLFSLLLSFGTLRLKSDLFITGLSINLLVPALVGWLSQVLFKNQGVVRLQNPPQLQVIFPFGGDQWFFPFDLLQGRSVFFWIVLLATIATHYLLFKTPWGLRLRTAGSSPALLRSRGLHENRFRVQALGLSGALASLGGAALALHLGAFVPGMSAGRGWIALVALYLGFRQPWLIFLACFFIAGTEQLSHALQGWWQLPSGVILSIPSLVTVAVFVIYSALKTRKRT